MDAISKRPGKRDRTCEPIRGHDATRRPTPLTFYALPITPCRAGLPRRSISAKAGASARRRLHVSRFTHHALPRRSSRSKAGSRFTPIVTAEFDIFFTISIQYFENTPHRPLPLNHLCKMTEESVKFQVDFACRAGASERRRAPPEWHRRPADVLLPSTEATRKGRLGRSSPRFPAIHGRLASCQLFANWPPTCANLRTA